MRQRRGCAMRQKRPAPRASSPNALRPHDWEMWRYDLHAFADSFFKDQSRHYARALHEQKT